MEFSLQPTATECPICLDTYVDPRVLTACGHSVCAGCVQKVLDSQKKTGKSNKISCPECEMHSTVPATGLPKNYRLAGCRQKVLKADLFRCDTCPKAGDKEILLCAKCVVKTHRAHDVVEFDKASQKEIEDVLDELRRDPNRAQLQLSMGFSDVKELGERIRDTIW
ncbi:midline-2-like protein [Aphelenchoides avenae]|nr:midline-2-like protein [Aphelenchus avenae]